MNLQPVIGFRHDVKGTTPAPIGNFVEHRKGLNLGLRADFLNRRSGEISYTNFFGGGQNNPLRDRDFLSFNLKYSFLHTSREELMNIRSTTLIVWGIALVMSVSISTDTALAKVSAKEAARLGKDLTPTGAVRAANANGTIPEWTGGITPPAGYKVGDHHPDPFADDPILFTITAANADQYRDKLSAGQLAMLEAYPTYKMNVYPTRRSHSYPQRVYDAIRANATRAELVADGNGIRGAVISSSFPLPQSGLEVLWNHKVRYLGLRLERTFA